ncbi:MAG: protein kinase [Myxococcales bacterium]|nr:protein kinase [Myxococcales bacterium]MBL0193186.1 protein kinase [Myxococcales bacterium]
MNCPHCQAPVIASQPFCGKCGGALAKTAGQDPLIGQMIAGRYRIVKLLGEGGMGSVYLAEQNLGATVRKVAVKTLHAHLSQDEAIRTRFQREVSTVAALEHPNTIRVFDFGTSDAGQLFIVMELVQGQSLGDALTAAKRFSPERTKKILAQVCGALGEAHELGIVHRDLKPDNIILTSRAGQEDFVKLLDFGIAKRESATSADQKLTQQGTVLGTPPYMSPEQFTGTSVDARSDIYALGVMAYEMLTGELPFSANTAWEWATQHMRMAPKPIEGEVVPRPMRKAIERALSKAPDARFPTVAAFIEAFAAERTTDPGAPLALASVLPVAPAAPPQAARRSTEIGEAYVPPAAPGYAAASFSAPSFSPPSPAVGALASPAGGTQPGAPAMDAFAASASAPYASGAGYGGAPHRPAPAYGPAGGAHAALHRPPVHHGGSSAAPRRGKGLLIGAGIIALFSVTAIVVAATGVGNGLFSSKTPTTSGVPLGLTTPTTPATTAEPTSTVPTTADTHAPLDPAATAAPTFAPTPPKPSGKPAGPGPKPTGPGPAPAPTPTPTPAPTPTPTPAPTPAPTLPFPFPFPPVQPAPTPTNPSPTPTPVSMKCQQARAMPPGPQRDGAIQVWCK